jgi:hypothetical protein
MEYKNEETDSDDEKNNKSDKTENEEKSGEKKNNNGDTEEEKGEGGIGIGIGGEGSIEGESGGGAEMISDVNVKDVRRIKDLGLQALTSILQSKVIILTFLFSLFSSFSPSLFSLFLYPFLFSTYTAY